MKLQFAKKHKTREDDTVICQYGGVIIPNWVWCAIKKEAKEEGKSEHWVVKKALRNYLNSKGYTAEQFVKVKREVEYERDDNGEEEE